jgi:hypothetical protein
MIQPLPPCKFSVQISWFTEVRSNRSTDEEQEEQSQEQEQKAGAESRGRLTLLLR